MTSTDVIVVGGGIMGCSAALRLAQAGLSVCVLERSVPGAEASTAAAGILGPLMEAGALYDGLQLLACLLGLLDADCRLSRCASCVVGPLVLVPFRI